MGAPFKNDETLLAACLQGDGSAWDEFLRRFSRLIYWSIRQTIQESRFRGRDDIAGDVFQDVFGRLFERREILRLKDASNIRKFLVVLSANLTHDRLKALSRHEGKSVYIDAISEEGAPEDQTLQASRESDPAQSAVRNEKRLMVSEVLDGLGSRERACLELHFFDGRTHREISMILGIPQDTVSSVIRRAKDKIREKFIHKGLFDERK